MKLVIEVKAGEGGKDAQLLVSKQAAIYQAYAVSNSIKHEVLAQGLG